MEKRIEVTSKKEAWEIVNQIFPSDYSEDTGSSERAGYPVYRGVEYYDYICDLGDRLEVNLKEGNKTINVWIVEPEDKMPARRGGVAYTVECERLPVKYVIHMTGFEVSEIIEEIFK